MKAIRNPKDFWSGILFLVIGLAFLVVAQDYAFGTARRMGPSFFPTVLSVILAVIGVVTIVRSFLTDGEKIQGFALKGLILITLGSIIFGVVIRGAGMIAGVALITLITAYGSVKFHWRTAIIMAVVLAAFCAVVFVYALGLPIPIIGPWIGG